jgi:dTMP kinase
VRRNRVIGSVSDLPRSLVRVTGTPLFVVLEGGEGSGKSTVAAALADALRIGGREVISTREPGGTRAAEALRSLLLDDRFADADPWCEALLFAAARADHVARVIRPALDRGAVVVCDRFVDSSVAYQGVALGLGEQQVRQANAPAIRGAVPDLTVVLDIPADEGLARAVGRNRMEARGLSFHRAVRAAFLEFAARDPGGYLVIDSHAAQPPAVVAQIVARLAQVGTAS